jgi:hypothetical protein
MFELHVVVAGIVMFNILELIMEIVPNYSTWTELPDLCSSVNWGYNKPELPRHRCLGLILFCLRVSHRYLLTMLFFMVINFRLWVP